MKSVKSLPIYSQVVKELEYSFGTFYVFNGYLISEINEDVNFSWDHHAIQVVDDVSCYLGTLGNNIVYVSNRIHSYSLVASDWLKFFKNYYDLKGYYIVQDKQKNRVNALFEDMFFNGKIKYFQDLEDAIESAESIMINQLGA